jgi:hypothetical protein
MQTKFEVSYTWLVMTLDKYQLYMLCYTTSNEFILVDFFLGGLSINYVNIFRGMGRSKIEDAYSIDVK